MNLRAIEQAIKNRKQISTEEKTSDMERREAQVAFEKSECPEYQRIDFFLSTENTEIEKQELIIKSLKDPTTRDSMLDWLQNKFPSSYNINKRPELWDNCRPDDNSWNPFTPAREQWKLSYYEAVGAHQWQIKDDNTWDDAGDPSDIALQIYENGWIVMARTATDVRGFKVT